MSQRIVSARDEVAEAMCVVMRAQDLAPELASELQRIDEGLRSIRERLEGQAGDAPPPTTTVGSLYTYTSHADDPEWEAKLGAVMTIQIHVGVASSDLFGQDPDTPEDERNEYDEPPPQLDGADDLRQAFADVEAALNAARQRLRELPH